MLTAAAPFKQQLSKSTAFFGQHSRPQFFVQRHALSDHFTSLYYLLRVQAWVERGPHRQAADGRPEEQESCRHICRPRCASPCTAMSQDISPLFDSKTLHGCRQTETSVATRRAKPSFQVWRALRWLPAHTKTPADCTLALQSLCAVCAGPGGEAEDCAPLQGALRWP